MPSPSMPPSLQLLRSLYHCCSWSLHHFTIINICSRSPPLLLLLLLRLLLGLTIRSWAVAASFALPSPPLLLLLLLRLLLGLNMLLLLLPLLLLLLESLVAITCVLPGGTKRQQPAKAAAVAPAAWRYQAGAACSLALPLLLLLLLLLLPSFALLPPLRLLPRPRPAPSILLLLLLIRLMMLHPLRPLPAPSLPPLRASSILRTGGWGGGPLLAAVAHQATKPTADIGGAAAHSAISEPWASVSAAEITPHND